MVSLTIVLIVTIIKMLPRPDLTLYSSLCKGRPIYAIIRRCEQQASWFYLFLWRTRVLSWRNSSSDVSVSFCDKRWATERLRRLASLFPDQLRLICWGSVSNERTTRRAADHCRPVCFCINTFLCWFIDARWQRVQYNVDTSTSQLRIS